MPVRAKDGKLFFDFFWRCVRCKEYTGLADKAENRRLCERKMAAVHSAIKRGSFDYRAHFPRGSRLPLFYPDDYSRDGHTISLGEYLARWHERRSPILADGTVVRDAELHPSTWIHDASTIGRLKKSLGHLRLAEMTTAHCNQFRRFLVDDGRSGKTVANIMGLHHKALSDAADEGFIERNPVVRVTTRKTQRSRRQRVTANPLTPSEVSRFLQEVPADYHDLYAAWFRLGWRSSEIVALRFGWLDHTHQVVKLRAARMPRYGGIEAEPKTGPARGRLLERASNFLDFQPNREALNNYRS
jgi:integrase